MELLIIIVAVIAIGIGIFFYKGDNTSPSENSKGGSTSPNAEKEIKSE